MLCITALSAAAAAGAAAAAVASMSTEEPRCHRWIQQHQLAAAPSIAVCTASASRAVVQTVTGNACRV